MINPSTAATLAANPIPEWVSITGSTRAGKVVAAAAEGIRGPGQDCTAI